MTSDRKAGHKPAHLELLTLRQAAELLGITPDTLRAQVHRGRLSAIKLGRDWIVDQAELDRYQRETKRSDRADLMRREPRFVNEDQRCWAALLAASVEALCTDL